MSNLKGQICPEGQFKARVNSFLLFLSSCLLFDLLAKSRFLLAATVAA